MLTTHHGSHAGLVTRVDAAGVTPGVLDAIIVPTVRPGWHLSSALEVTSELGCQLLCLSSGDSDPGDILKVADSVDAEVIVIDTSVVLPRLLPSLCTTRFITETGFARSTDLSSKRNLGLLLSKAMGWRKILFLDDDIRELAAGDLGAMAGLLDEFDAVGLGNTGYPDNSVVCHAYRKAGGRQDTFVSGGLLSVRADHLDGFFPDIYSEDWFLLHGVNRIARTGAAYQDKYDPFAAAGRARDEELGDCLAEGLYWLRDEGLAPQTAHDERFWNLFLEGRRMLIDEVAQRLEAGWRDDRDSCARQLASLAAARAVHKRITPSLCTAYIRDWETDLAKWGDYRDDVRTPSSIEECLRQLEVLHRKDPDADAGTDASIDWETRVHRSS